MAQRIRWPVVLSIATMVATYAQGAQMSEVRTYLAFTYPVEPIKIGTIPDMDLSYALGGTLVEWTPDKQIRAALAESWEVTDTHTVVFRLRKNAKWSDSTPLSSEHVKLSLLRGLRIQPEDLRSFTLLVKRIDCPTANSLIFTLRAGKHAVDLLRKLTEPNYGIFNVVSGDRLNLTRTTGAFALTKDSSARELALKVNTHWHRYTSDMPQSVLIRQPPANFDPQTILLDDVWPNLAQTASLLKESQMQTYRQKGFSIWKRSVDKVVLLQMTKVNSLLSGSFQRLRTI